MAGILRGGATPIYAQLIMHFRHQIESGRWPLHETIPALNDLATEFGVTRATVRQAVGFLQRERLLASKRGSGTRVIGTPRKNIWQSLPNAWEELVRDSERIETDNLDLAQPVRLPAAPRTESGKLAPNYHVMRRLFRLEGVPFFVGTSYIDRRVVDEVGAKSLQSGSLYRAIEKSRRFRATRGDQLLTLGSADAELAFLLEIPMNSTVVHLFRWVFDTHDTLIYQSEALFRSDFVQASRRLR